MSSRTFTSGGGGGGGVTLSLIAAQDLTAGDPVGYATNIDNAVSLAVRGVGISTASGNFNFNNMVWLDDDRFVVSFVSNVGTGGAALVVGTVNRDSMTVTWGGALVFATSEGVGSFSVMKLDINKVAVSHCDDGSNVLRLTTFSVAGTTLTQQGATVTIFSGDNNFVQTDAIQLGTDQAIIWGSEPPGSPNVLAHVTWSGFVPTVTDTDVGAQINGGPWNNTNIRIVKIDTNKFFIVTPNHASGNHKMLVGTISAGVISLGSLFNIGNTTGGANAVSPATDTIVANVSGSSYVINISGTTPTIGATVNSGTGVLLYNPTDNEVLEFSSGIYVLPWTISTISRVLKYGPLSANAGGGGAYSVDNSYYVFMGTQSSINGTASTHIEGMSIGFIGFAQTSVTLGNNVSVKISGTDTNQIGLNPGSLYEIIDGGLVITDDPTVIWKVQAQNSTTVII